MSKTARTSRKVQPRPILPLASLALLLILWALVVGNSAAQNVTSTSVTLHWTSPGDNGNTGTATIYDIRYSTANITEANWNTISQASGEPSPQVAGSDETFTITGLQPSTTYYISIKTADEVPNWSGLSNIISRTTLAETTPPSAIANLAAGSPTLSSISLYWSAPGDDGNVGTATQYDIRYATSTITEANWNNATQIANEPTPLVAGTSQNYTVTGLSQSTTYYFAIKTRDEVPNWSALSNIASAATTTESTSPSAIADLTLDQITATGVRLQWHAPGDDGTVGTAAQYDVRYATVPITLANWNQATQATGEPAPLLAGTSQNFTVTGLTPDTRYYFAIRTADEVPNLSGLSNVPDATTLDNVAPSNIMDLSALPGDNGGEITITWTAPGDNGSQGTASYYLILYSNDTITSSNWEEADYCVSPPSPLPAGQSQSHTLCDLTPGTEYCVAVKAYDEALNGSNLSNVEFSVSQTGFILDTDDEDDDGSLPEKFALSQNYPNPFNPNTVIEYSLPRTAHVKLEIYNVLGQLTATLLDSQMPAGKYAVDWNGLDNNGLAVATGLYMYRIQADDFSQSRKMVMVK